MSSNLSTEVFAVVLTALFTGLLWVPIIVNRLVENGLWPALKNPEPDVQPRSTWAYRLAHAHRNAIENLAVFAPLALAVHIQGAGDALTATWSLIFVATRVAHAFIYAMGVPLLRTIAFFLGFLAQLVLALRLLGLI